ncbi:hypothetical protein HanPSC8_Chr10g0428051 [Helianthus annuus]|nr:hypothetical protein HanPSC8_Chr10g0428051 [Helianthus annuus]
MRRNRKLGFPQARTGVLCHPWVGNNPNASPLMEVGIEPETTHMAQVLSTTPPKGHWQC